MEQDFVTNNQKNSNAFIVKKIGLNDIKEEKIVTNIENTLHISNNKIINDSLNNFYIDTETGMYLENADGIKSYTFPVIRENSTKLENLTVLLYPNNTIRTFLVDYNLNYEDVNNNNQSIIETTPIDYYEIDFKTGNLNLINENQTNSRWVCNSIFIYQIVDCGDLVGADEAQHMCHILVSVTNFCWEGEGGGVGATSGYGNDPVGSGNGYNNGSGGTGSNGSNTGSNIGSSNGIITTPLIPINTEEIQAKISREKDFKNGLTWAQKAWLNNNATASQSIFEFLESQVNNLLSTEYSNESEHFAIELIDTSIQMELNMAAIWNNDYEAFRNQMSNAEREIFDNILPNRQMWYMASAYKALQKSNELFPNTYIPSNSHNGKGDAFRHALWNAYFTGFCGATLAEQLTTAHEENIDPYNPFPQKEIEMDLYNNQKGRSIANYSNIDNVTQNVLDYLNSGGLRYLNALNPNPPYYPTFYSTLIPTNQ